jgi:hypothetical protein
MRSLLDGVLFLLALTEYHCVVIHETMTNLHDIPSQKIDTAFGIE